MGDLLKQGSDWLESQRTRHASRTVTYQRGGQSVQLAATIGQTLFEIDTGTGLQERFEARDFLVLAVELVLGGNATLPARGDRILETDGATTFTYEVMAPGKEPHFRYSDPYRKTLRIHTKQVAEAAT